MEGTEFKRNALGIPFNKQKRGNETTEREPRNYAMTQC